MAIKKRAKYTSKGERKATAKRWCGSERDIIELSSDKWDAYIKGKRVYFTIPNPNPNERNKKMIRVLAQDLMGKDSRKYASFVIMRD